MQTIAKLHPQLSILSSQSHVTDVNIPIFPPYLISYRLSHFFSFSFHFTMLFFPFFFCFSASFSNFWILTIISTTTIFFLLIISKSTYKFNGNNYIKIKFSLTHFFLHQFKTTNLCTSKCQIPILFDKPIDIYIIYNIYINVSAVRETITTITTFEVYSMNNKTLKISHNVQALRLIKEETYE